MGIWFGSKGRVGQQSGEAKRAGPYICLLLQKQYKPKSCNFEQSSFAENKQTILQDTSIDLFKDCYKPIKLSQVFLILFAKVCSIIPIYIFVMANKKISVITMFKILNSYTSQS